MSYVHIDETICMSFFETLEDGFGSKTSEAKIKIFLEILSTFSLSGHLLIQKAVETKTGMRLPRQQGSGVSPSEKLNTSFSLKTFANF